MNVTRCPYYSLKETLFYVTTPWVTCLHKGIRG
jgi:hypothetical protein